MPAFPRSERPAGANGTALRCLTESARRVPVRGSTDYKATDRGPPWAQGRSRVCRQPWRAEAVNVASSHAERNRCRLDRRDQNTRLLPDSRCGRLKRNRNQIPPSNVSEQGFEGALHHWTVTMSSISRLQETLNPRTPPAAAAPQRACSYLPSRKFANRVRAGTAGARGRRMQFGRVNGLP